MRTYANAVNEFVESTEFKSASDPVSLRAPESMRRYLENRLLRAFEDGWKAREHMPKESSVNG